MYINNDTCLVYGELHRAFRITRNHRDKVVHVLSRYSDIDTGELIFSIQNADANNFPGFSEFVTNFTKWVGHYSPNNFQYALVMKEESFGVVVCGAWWELYMKCDEVGGTLPVTLQLYVLLECLDYIRVKLNDLKDNCDLDEKWLYINEHLQHEWFAKPFDEMLKRARDIRKGRCNSSFYY